MVINCILFQFNFVGQGILKVWDSGHIFQICWLLDMGVEGKGLVTLLNQIDRDERGLHRMDTLVIRRRS